MALAIVSSERSSGRLPGKEALKKCIELATTTEGAEYFYEEFARRLEGIGLNKKSPAILDELRNYAKNVRYKNESIANPWRGDMALPTGFQNFQHHLATDAANKIGGDNIAFHFAINDAAHFIRGYSIDGQSPGDTTVTAMDTLFNAWLAKNHMISKGGVIYEATEKGDIKVDQQGRPVRVQPDKITKMIDDKTHGFERYVKNNNQSVQLTIHQHAFPEEKLEEKKERVTQKAEQAGKVNR